MMEFKNCLVQLIVITRRAQNSGRYRQVYLKKIRFQAITCLWWNLDIVWYTLSVARKIPVATNKVTVTGQP